MKKYFTLLDLFSVIGFAFIGKQINWKEYNPVSHKKTRANESGLTVQKIKSFPQMKYGEMEAVDNVSTVMQFVLLQFSDIPVLQGLLFHLNPMKGSPSFTSLS